MKNKEEIIEAADRILKMNKSNWSMPEMSILIQSQYYNIEDLFTFGANYQEDNIELQIQISEEIISICKSFHNNMKLVPNVISWDEQKTQINRVEKIYEEVSKTLKVQVAMKNFRDEPTHWNAMQLQQILNN